MKYSIINIILFGALGCLSTAFGMGIIQLSIILITVMGICLNSAIAGYKAK